MQCTRLNSYHTDRIGVRSDRHQLMTVRLPVEKRRLSKRSQSTEPVRWPVRCNTIVCGGESDPGLVVGNTRHGCCQRRSGTAQKKPSIDLSRPKIGNCTRGKVCPRLDGGWLVPQPRNVMGSLYKPFCGVDDRYRSVERCDTSTRPRKVVHAHTNTAHGSMCSIDDGKYLNKRRAEGRQHRSTVGYTYWELTEKGSDDERVPI